MQYKNKEVASLYKLWHHFLIAGVILALIGAILLGYGLYAAERTRRDVHPYEEFLTRKGNHATGAATFEVTQASGRVGGYSHGDYYIVTDGKRCIISEMTEAGHQEMIRELDANGVYHLKGLTEFIVNKDERKEIARNASIYLGKNITEDNLEQYFGEVQLKNTGHSYFAIFWSGYFANLLIGGMLLLVGTVMMIMFGKSVKASCRIESLSGITFSEVNEEISRKSCKWYPVQVCLTDDLLVGFRADPSKSITSQMAFKYSEVRRIYGVNKKKAYGDPSNSNGHYVVYVIAEDGKEYVLADTLRFSWNDSEITNSAEAMIRELKNRVPGLEYGPANIVYRVFRFPFSVQDPEDDETYYEGAEGYEMVKNYLDDLSDMFSLDHLASYFSDPEAIYDMSLSFTEDGFAEIKVGYPSDYAEKVEPTIEEFLRGQLMDGWGENLEAGEYSVVFRADV
ncbi:MAG: hypothetical protein J5825_02510 [Lachnospiraceae bacterium]|nr:hypothetical protein [Lachnospiraceae bacterium]